MHLVDIAAFRTTTSQKTKSCGSLIKQPQRTLCHNGERLRPYTRRRKSMIRSLKVRLDWHDLAALDDLLSHFKKNKVLFLKHYSDRYWQKPNLQHRIEIALAWPIYFILHKFPVGSVGTLLAFIGRLVGPRLPLSKRSEKASILYGPRHRLTGRKK